MRWLDTRWIVAAAALVASGCLLPQPDTPWVPPAVGPNVPAPMAGEAERAGSAGNATITAPAQPPESPAPDPGPSARAWVQVSGRVSGLDATAIAAVAEGGWRTVAPLGADGEFALSVTWGLFNRYWLELTTPGGVVRLEPPIVLSGPGARRITIRAEGDRVTLEEEATLTPAVSPAPASPAPSVTP